ncbi:MAG: biotin transporter BioY [Armatimonadota bacterium]|nr:biotin transporter BioY [Armatimonadota bacterium]
MTYAAVFRPAEKPYAIVYDLVCILGGTLFIALSAQVSISLPFSPVPITGQTLAVLLVGVLLGSHRAGLCLLTYLAEGSIGLPVFAGGKAGIAHLLGPTGGYLLGFVPAAFLVGWLAERGWDRRATSAFAAMLVGNMVIYIFGLPWLACFVGMERVMVAGLLPFIPGDLAKIVLATAMLPWGWKLLKRAGVDMPT